MRKRWKKTRKNLANKTAMLNKTHPLRYKKIATLEVTKKRKSLKTSKSEQKKSALCKPTNNKLTNGLLFALVHNYNENINQQKKN